MKTTLKQSFISVVVLLCGLASVMPAAASEAAKARDANSDAVKAKATAADALPDAPTPDAGTPDAATPDAATGSGSDSSSMEASATVRDSGKQLMSQGAQQPQMTGLGRLLYPSYTSKYSTVVQPGVAFETFSPGEKLLYSIRESVSPGQLSLVVLDAGFNHVIGGDPRYGSDSGAFAARIGAIGLRQASMHVISDGIYASIFRQDERYFRKGPGTPVRGRIKYVLTSIFMTRGNNGNTQVDASGLLGRATGAAMTMAYYPKISANGSVAARTFGYALLGEMSANAYIEFWPDVWLHMFPNKSKR
jgi:hypothetical protein